MSKFDIVDDGIPATFIDGPKEGHVGVVNPEEGMPPKTLQFFEGSLIYVRHGKTKVKAADAGGRPQSYKGVAYRVDKTCPFMQEVRKELLAAAADRAGHGMEIQR